MGRDNRKLGWKWDLAGIDKTGLLQPSRISVAIAVSCPWRKPNENVHIHHGVEKTPLFALINPHKVLHDAACVMSIKRLMR